MLVVATLVCLKSAVNQELPVQMRAVKRAITFMRPVLFLQPGTTVLIARNPQLIDVLAETAMSPLQYQKQLRLQVARGRMLIHGLDAGCAACGVGYESASQFSREYSRFFGQPPLRDIRALRSPGAPPLESVGRR